MQLSIGHTIRITIDSRLHLVFQSAEVGSHMPTGVYLQEITTNYI